MNYKILDQNELDEQIIAYYHSQERDHYCHTINKERYEKILKNLSKEHPFRFRIEKLLEETNSRLEEVEQILLATESQLPQNIERIRICKEKLKFEGKI